MVDHLIPIAILAASLYAWVRQLGPCLRSGFRVPLLHPRPRPAPFWSFADVIVWVGLCILTYSVLGGIAVGAGWIGQGEPVPAASATDKTRPQLVESLEEKPASAEAPIDQALGFSVPKILLFSASTLLATFATIGLLFFRSNRPAHQLGLIPQRGDVGIGLLGSLLIIPPVLAIMLTVTSLVDTQYRHEVLEALQANPRWSSIAALFFSAVIAAPVAEEFLFRVLLQGSLQRIGRWRPADEADDRDGRLAVPRSYWPILISSLVFAGIHWDQFPAPIPLFFMAVGLGYLYRQTGSMMPCLIVHMMLNGLTMIVAVTRLLVEQS